MSRAQEGNGLGLPHNISARLASARASVKGLSGDIISEGLYSPGQRLRRVLIRLWYRYFADRTISNSTTRAVNWFGLSRESFGA